MTGGCEEGGEEHAGNPAHDVVSCRARGSVPVVACGGLCFKEGEGGGIKWMCAAVVMVFGAADATRMQDNHMEGEEVDRGGKYML